MTVSIMQCSSTEPQTAASKMTLELNQHLSWIIQKQNIQIFMKLGFMAGLTTDDTEAVSSCCNQAKSQ